MSALPAPPLKGRTVLDCSTLLPGPFAGRLLAEQGARVIKIENPNRPDGARVMGNAYDYLNSMKEIVALDLLSPADRARFGELAAGADAVLEGFRPAAKLKLGLDEGTLLKINPRLCIGSLVGYPEEGLWRDRAGHDLNFQAVTGVLSMFAEIPGLPLGDLFGAYALAFRMSAGLDAIARGAHGHRVVVSMSEALKDAAGLWSHEYRLTGQEPAPGTTLMSGKFPCYGIYRSADGRRVTVGAIEHKFWERVCAILELPDCVKKGFAVGPEGDATKAKIQAALGSKPWSHWEPLFDEADCCVEAVLSFSETY